MKEVLKKKKQSALLDSSSSGLKSMAIDPISSGSSSSTGDGGGVSMGAGAGGVATGGGGGVSTGTGAGGVATLGGGGETPTGTGLPLMLMATSMEEPASTCGTVSVNCSVTCTVRKTKESGSPVWKKNGQPQRPEPENTPRLLRCTEPEKQ